MTSEYRITGRVKCRAELSIFFSAIMLLAISTPIAFGELADGYEEKKWCQVGDERSNDPPWKDGMFNSMDMAFLEGSSKLIISEWPKNSFSTLPFYYYY